MATKLDRRDELIRHYLQAKSWIDRSPFVREVEWQRAVSPIGITETSFLREYAWVIFNSGFRETIIRKHFAYLSLCFCDWESAEAILQESRNCVACAAVVFNNQRKLGAVVDVARLIVQEGFEAFRSKIETSATTELEKLPFIGCVTKFHLGKNLGFDVAKPDRHLIRVADRFGYKDVQKMCHDIFEFSGDKIAVADLILWRFEERTFAS